MKRRTLLAFVAAVLATGPLPAMADDGLDVFAEIQSRLLRSAVLRAGFHQERLLHILKRPLVSSGRMVLPHARQGPRTGRRRPHGAVWGSRNSEPAGAPAVQRLRTSPGNDSAGMEPAAIIGSRMDHARAVETSGWGRAPLLPGTADSGRTGRRQARKCACKAAGASRRRPHCCRPVPFAQPSGSG